MNESWDDDCRMNVTEPLRSPIVNDSFIKSVTEAFFITVWVRPSLLTRSRSVSTLFHVLISYCLWASCRSLMMDIERLVSMLMLSFIYSGRTPKFFIAALILGVLRSRLILLMLRSGLSGNLISFLWFHSCAILILF